MEDFVKSLDASLPDFHTISRVSSFKPVFTPEGEALIEEIVRAHPLPVLILGETGGGKSVLIREAVKRKGLDVKSVNASPGLNLDYLVGMWRPSPLENGGFRISWQNGILTQCVEEGKAFLFEEVTRASQEQLSRLMGLLDNDFRYWSIPEAGKGVDVHPDFWFLSTANPVAEGYLTHQIDKAVHRRFMVELQVDGNVADETETLRRALGAKWAIRVSAFLEDARRDYRTKLTIADVASFTSLMPRGFSPQRIVKVSIIPRYPDFSDQLEALARAHF